MLIITGAMGAGKTAVLGEASDILSQRQIVHAAIDLDAFGLAHAHLPSSARRMDLKLIHERFHRSIMTVRI